MAASIKKFTGETILWTNGTGSDVAVGDLVRVGSFLNGRATVDIASTATGTIQIEGIVEVDSATGYTASIGDRAYYDVADKKVNSDTGNVLCGIYTKAKATGDTKAEVLLLPVNAIGVTPYQTVNDTVASGQTTKAVTFPGAASGVGRYGAFLAESTTSTVYVLHALPTGTNEVTVTLSGNPGASNADVTVFRLS